MKATIDLNDPELTVRPGHHPMSLCQLKVSGCRSTVAEAVASLIYGCARTMAYDGMIRRLESGNDKLVEQTLAASAQDEVRMKHVITLVEAYFAANPNGLVRFGIETPRGGRRHGGVRRWGPTFYVKTGTERHYFPGLTVYMRRGEEVLATANRVYVKCRCWGPDRAQTPRHTTLWSAGV